MRLSIELTLLNIVLAICSLTVPTRGDCDECQPGNSVACHSETVFSLCIDGNPTYDYITCPSGSICTRDEFVCYPELKSIATCARTEVIPVERNYCAICNGPDNVFSCINETTIAFCFGNPQPNLDAVAYCPENTVCDIKNSKNFCSDSDKVMPSCRPESTPTTTATSEPPTTTTITRTTITTEVPTTITTPSTTTTTTTTEAPKTPPTTTTTKAPTTTPTTTTTEATTTTPTTTTTEAPTTTTTTSTTTEQPALTTTPKQQDLDTFCSENPTGSYKPDNDVTCTQYIHCFLVGAGVLKDCPTGQYFDPSRGFCGPAKPDSSCPDI